MICRENIFVFISIFEVCYVIHRGRVESAVAHYYIIEISRVKLESYFTIGGAVASTAGPDMYVSVSPRQNARPWSNRPNSSVLLYLESRPHGRQSSTSS